MNAQSLGKRALEFTAAERYTVAREPLQTGHSPAGPLLPNSLLPWLSKSLMNDAPPGLPAADDSALDDPAERLGAAM